MSKMNAFYAQSGGVTAVINATACGVIETARKHPNKIANVYAGRNGIIGALTEDMIDTNRESAKVIAGLSHTPGGAFGSARYKLKRLEENRAEYERLIEVFKAHNIGYFFYNGGNDSMDTAHKVSQISRNLGFPVTCLGIPKTVDNDLPVTDNCPGFGSVAKYVAVSTKEAALDVLSMAKTSTKVFVLEVMGRHAGWIAAAGGLAGQGQMESRRISFFSRKSLSRNGHSSNASASASKNMTTASSWSARAQAMQTGKFLAEAGTVMRSATPSLAASRRWLPRWYAIISGFKYHYAVADYLQRSARHIASATDVKQAYAVGQAAVQMALAGETAVMPVIKRVSDKPYRWKIEKAPLSGSPTRKRCCRGATFQRTASGITAAARRYLEPLIRGERLSPIYQWFTELRHT